MALSGHRSHLQTDRMEPDRELDRYRAQRAAEHQRACLDGLSTDRLRVVRARLLADDDNSDPAILARIDVVTAEIERRMAPR
jgi:hypothetical protein